MDDTADARRFLDLCGRFEYEVVSLSCNKRGSTVGTGRGEREGKEYYRCLTV